MSHKVFSSREFNQDIAAAKRAAKQKPVIITSRGEPSHVLMSIEAYRKLTQPRQSIADLLYMEGGEDIDFEPGEFTREFPKQVDL